MNKFRNIKKLKKEAANHYLAWRSIVDSFGCGLYLSEYISSEMVFHKQEFNKIMNKLAELDSLTPAIRL